MKLPFRWYGWRHKTPLIGLGLALRLGFRAERTRQGFAALNAAYIDRIRPRASERSNSLSLRPCSISRIIIPKLPAHSQSALECKILELQGLAEGLAN